MSSITEITAQVAELGYTTARWMGQEYSLDEIRTILAEDQLGVASSSWHGMLATVASRTIESPERPTKAEVEAAAAHLGSTSTSTGTTWKLIPCLVFPLELHPNGDATRAYNRTEDARRWAGIRGVDRSEYEDLCARCGVTPLDDDAISARPAGTWTIDHAADPTGHHRVTNILADARRTGLVGSARQPQQIIVAADTEPRSINSADHVAAMLGHDVPTAATLRGECHYCGLPLRRGRCDECV